MTTMRAARIQAAAMQRGWAERRLSSTSSSHSSCTDGRVIGVAPISAFGSGLRVEKARRIALLQLLDLPIELGRLVVVVPLLSGRGLCGALFGRLDGGGRRLMRLAVPNIAIARRIGLQTGTLRRCRECRCQPRRSQADAPDREDQGGYKRSRGPLIRTSAHRSLLPFNLRRCRHPTDGRATLIPDMHLLHLSISLMKDAVRAPTAIHPAHTL